MKKIIRSFSLCVFAISVAVYVISRMIFPYLISDDASDWFLWSGGVSIFILLSSRIPGIQSEIRLLINIVLGLAIFFCIAFALWGLFTTEGRQQYDGMSALIPFYVLLIAGALVIILIVANIIWRRVRN